MPKKIAKTDLYRLIEAGHLARHALLQPLLQLGLMPGDDAIVLALGETASGALSETLLQERTGFDRAMLSARLYDLAGKDIVLRPQPAPGDTATIQLTPTGKAVAVTALTHWRRLDAALMDEIKPAGRKRLRTMLKRFAALLSLE